MLLILCFGARIVLAQGWYIVTYALAIYHLNLLLAFLTPKIDPAAMDFDQDDGRGDGDGLERKKNREKKIYQSN